MNFFSKLIFIISLISFIFPLNVVFAKNTLKYATYGNSRFGYTTDYPGDFKKGEAPANNDGRVFTSPDGFAFLTVYGMNNVLNYTVESLYNDCLANISGKVTYKVKKKNWFIVSGVEEENIFYQKTFVGKGSVNTFIFTYPKSQANYYNPVTEHIEATFVPGDLLICH